MAILRQQNLLGQQRVDVPHLRALESGVAADFDALVGRLLTGEHPLVVRGLTVSGAGVGNAASNLSVLTADALVANLNAVPAGSLLWVPADRAAETLNPLTNARVRGAWVPGTRNYVGMEFTRLADDSTVDLVKFQDETTLKEQPRLVDLGKVLDYRFVITVVPLGSQPDLVPVLAADLDSNGLLANIIDSRPLMFRLGSGGDTPDTKHSFSGWSRREVTGATDNTAFTGGDKSIASLKDWQDAVMTRLWEVGGGEFWYSGTADRNVRLITLGTPSVSGEYFTWNSGTGLLAWQGLRLLMDNSQGYSVEIASGSATLYPGQVLYVDLPRSGFYAPAWSAATYAIGDLRVNNSLTYECTTAGTSVTGPTGTGIGIADGGTARWKYVGPGTAGSLVATTADLVNLGTGSPPGSRWVLAWRTGDQVFSRDWRYPIGTTWTPATTTTTGVVKLNATPAPGDATAPIVVSLDANHQASVTATGGTYAFTGTGAAAGGGIWGISGGAGTYGLRGDGVTAGIRGIGTGAGNAIGVQGDGANLGSGGVFLGGDNGLGDGGNGIDAYAGAGNRHGVNGRATGDGSGVRGTASATGSSAATGVWGNATTSSGIGVKGTGGSGGATGYGGHFTATHASASALKTVSAGGLAAELTGGNVQVDSTKNYVYSGPVSHVKILSATEAITNQNGNLSYIAYGLGSNGKEPYITGVQNPNNLEAVYQLRVPAGATITLVEVLCKSPATGTKFSWTMTRLTGDGSMAGGSAEANLLIANPTSLYNSVLSWMDLRINGSFVVNENDYIILHFYVNSIDQSLYKIGPCRVTYTMNTVLPEV